MSTIRIVHSDQEQLDAWVNGEAAHWEVTPGRFDCMPDFSCCRPHLLQPIEVRRAFIAASPREREAYLMSFLGGCVADAAPELAAHITNGSGEASS